MKIAKIEDLHCDAGWRDFSFLKITTDDGIVGWSEYNEGYGSAGLTRDYDYQYQAEWRLERLFVRQFLRRSHETGPAFRPRTLVS